ncbi:hypothetical protein DMN91_008670 [Ooceraea biroi]|uniref:Uncharacterized protein n=1 Tax=Ooceraea biroi TaxID=2015173 RepID=A0A3L8DDT6_OOCBI|nr:hypothetical protein DMN91_008670 [Ooceraea biroi]
MPESVLCSVQRGWVGNDLANCRTLSGLTHSTHISDDEEESASVRHKYIELTVLLSGTKWEKDELSRPLCDEEKTERKNLLENADVLDLISHTSQMRKSSWPATFSPRRSTERNPL